ncbi:sulfatase-like hydrolase/transferase [Vibrio sp. WXL103]|uniref:sulfatase-like hydrolase/transferase n=1 Tax=Vibrio sp. WXL103 TaxID=3450710 RepID=UPI003EC73D46
MEFPLSKASKVAGLTLISAAIIAGCSGVNEGQTSASNAGAAYTFEPADVQPNILWIITDDQRMDSIAAFNRAVLGQNDSELGKVLSPNVDKLAERGTTFINTYNQNPACAPSRTSMITGRYSHHTSIYGFEYYDPTGMDHWRPYTTQVLSREAGYQTVSVGKRGLRYKAQDTIYDVDLGYKEFWYAGLCDTCPPHWKEKGDVGLRYHMADGRMLDVPKRNSSDMMDTKEVWDTLDILTEYPGEKKEYDYGKLVLGGVSPQGKDTTKDGWYTEELVNYLQNPGRLYKTNHGQRVQGLDPSKPLFAYLGLDAPHTPVLPPEEFRKQFQGIKYNVPEFTQEELDSFPPQIKNLYNAKRSNHYSDEDKQQMIADYYAFAAYADYLVGKAVDSFVEYSESNNRPWMVLYVCGDHGWRLNEHGMIAKFGPYDIDLQNPIIVTASDKDKFPAGKVVTDFTEFVDMAPTFLSAAGIDVTQPKYDYLDGYDLARVAAKTIEPRDYVIAEPTWVTGPTAVIRTHDYKFAMKIRPGHRPNNENIEWALTAGFEEIQPMLFDLRVDPKEVNNVAHDPHYRPVVDAMREKIQNIVLGNGRVEVKWGKWGEQGEVVVSDFAAGSDDKKIDVPHVDPKV